MENNGWGKVLCVACTRVRPYILVIFIQFTLSGMTVIAKAALDEGMSPSTFAVYRHILAAAFISPFALILERNATSRLTCSILVKIAALGLLEPVLDQNMFYTGMKYSSATFTAAMCNVLPAITFIMAWIIRLEVVRWRELRSIAKVLGTLVSVAGAMVMTFYKGSAIDMPWSRGEHYHSVDSISPAKETVKGAIFLVLGCIFWSAFVIVQAITLREFPAELTVAALMCIMGALQGTGVALVLERGNTQAWHLGWDTNLLAVVYAGIICSWSSLCIAGCVTRKKGPVFVTAFSPLGMIIVAVAGLFMLSEDLFLGRVIGAVLIVIGLYMVVWGKSKDQTQPTEEQELVCFTPEPERERELFFLEITKE